MEVPICNKITELNFHLLVRRGFDQALKNWRRPEKVQFKGDSTVSSRFFLRQRLHQTKGKAQAPKVQPVKNPKEATLANVKNSSTNAADIMPAKS